MMPLRERFPYGHPFVTRGLVSDYCDSCVSLRSSDVHTPPSGGWPEVVERDGGWFVPDGPDRPRRGDR